MIRPVTFQGVSNFDANLYALEVSSRFLDADDANGVYQSYKNHLAATNNGTSITVGTGALVVQGRMIEITEAETVAPAQLIDGQKGYVCLRIETYHPADEDNCTLVAYTGASLDAVKAALTQDDVYSDSSNDTNTVFECPLFSFSVSSGAITSVTRVIGYVESAVATAAEALETANAAAKTATAAASEVETQHEEMTAEIEELAAQIVAGQGTTVYKNGVAVASYDATDVVTKQGTAVNATHAAEADIAYYAAQCETAVNAETADTATEADHAASADTATNADNATEADHAAEADLADEATVANKLANALTVGDTSKGGVVFNGSAAKSIKFYVYSIALLDYNCSVTILTTQSTIDGSSTITTGTAVAIQYALKVIYELVGAGMPIATCMHDIYDTDSVFSALSVSRSGSSGSYTYSVKFFQSNNLGGVSTGSSAVSVSSPTGVCVLYRYTT